MQQTDKKSSPTDLSIFIYSPFPSSLRKKKREWDGNGNGLEKERKRKKIVRRKNGLGQKKPEQMFSLKDQFELYVT